MFLVIVVGRPVRAKPNVKIKYLLTNLVYRLNLAFFIYAFRYFPSFLLTKC